MPSDPDDIETFGGCAAERESNNGKSLLVRLSGAAVPRWIPKKVIHADSEVFEPGHKGKLVVARWFAEKEGLE